LRDIVTSSDPIAQVSVISTGTVAIHPEHVGPTWKNLRRSATGTTCSATAA
jgi:hypothetical protein